MKYVILLSLIIATVIIIPIESWAEYNHKWDELAKWKKMEGNQISILIIRDASVSQKHVDIVENTINSKERVNYERSLFHGWNEGIKEISKSYSYDSHFTCTIETKIPRVNHHLFDG